MDEQFESPERKLRRISRRSFLWAGVAVLGGYGGIKWIASRSNDMGVPWPLRRGLDFTDSFTSELVQKNAPMTKMQITLPARINGEEGMPEGVPDDFQLTLIGAGEDKVMIPMAELKK